MAGQGYIRLERGALEHPMFGRTEYSEFEAWVWLLCEAAWQPRRRRIGRFVVELQRGELAASLRFLAEKWLWHRNKVDRFLKRIESETMVVTRTETGISIITICNYEKYQGTTDEDGTVTGTSTGTLAGQGRDSSGTKENTLNSLNKDYRSKKRPESDPNFEQMWRDYPRRDGPNPRKPAETKYATLCRSGIDPAVINAGVKAFASDAHRRGDVGTRFIPQAITWLNQERWVGAISALTAAAPVAQDSEFWASVEQSYRKIGVWSRHAGPKPGLPGCTAPRDVVERVLQIDAARMTPIPTPSLVRSA